MIKKWSELVPGFVSTPLREDISDAVQYVSDLLEVPVATVQKLVSKRPVVAEMEPQDFIDDTVHFGTKPSGWLRDVPRQEWEEELEQEYSRDFTHIVRNYFRGNLAPGIQIVDFDGYSLMGDGRGRALFAYSLGIPMKVVTYG